MKYLVLIFVTLSVSLTSQAIPRNGDALKKAVSAKDEAEVQGALYDAGLDVSAKKFMELRKSGALSKRFAEKILSTDFSVAPNNQYKTMIDAILSSGAPPVEKSVLERFGIGGGDAGPKAPDKKVVKKMIKLSIDMMNGRSEDISPGKLQRVAELVGEANNGKDYETANRELATLFNEGLGPDDHLVKGDPLPDAFDIFGNCR